MVLDLNRTYIFIDLGVVLIGLLLTFGENIPLIGRRVGRLPGDFRFQCRFFECYLPVATVAIAASLFFIPLFVVGAL